MPWFGPDMGRLMRLRMLRWIVILFMFLFLVAFAVLIDLFAAFAAAAVLLLLLVLTLRTRGTVPPQLWIFTPLGTEFNVLHACMIFV